MHMNKKYLEKQGTQLISFLFGLFNCMTAQSCSHLEKTPVLQLLENFLIFY
jgi:hypothetical protein